MARLLVAAIGFISATLVTCIHMPLKPEIEDGHHAADDGAIPLMRRDGSLQSFPPVYLEAANAEDMAEDTSPAAKVNELGTIVLLMDADDQAEMEDFEKLLVPSLVSSVKFRTPVTVLYSGSAEAADDATIKLHLNPSLKPIMLVDVTQRVEHYAKEHSKFASEKQGKNWKMNEFWLMHAHMLPELQYFHYAWKLSPKANIVNDVKTDLYEVMQEQKAALGYRLLRSDHEKLSSCGSLQSAAQMFFRERAEYTPRTVMGQSFLDMYEQAQCPLWSSDFQLVNLDYLRNNEAYADYASFLADTGGFAKHEWGVPAAQAIFMATQAEPEKLLCMTPWVPVYHGESELSCNAGLGLMNFFHQTVKDKFEKAAVLQEGDVKKTNFTDVDRMLKEALADQPKQTLAIKEILEHKLSHRPKPQGHLARLRAWFTTRHIGVIAVAALLVLAALASLDFMCKKWSKKSAEEEEEEY